jgi:hypothetical protein
LLWTGGVERYRVEGSFYFIGDVECHLLADRNSFRKQKKEGRKS